MTRFRLSKELLKILQAPLHFGYIRLKSAVMLKSLSRLAWLTAGVLLILWPMAVLAQIEPADPPTPVPTITPISAETAVPEEPTSEPTDVPAPTEEPIVLDNDIPKVHIIQPGETLVSIAAVYSTTAELIQTLNNISDPSLIFAGQELVIPGVSGDALPTVYTVRLGDTLQGIAEVFNTSTEQIVDSAGLLSGRLYVGQALPLVSRTGSVSPFALTGQIHQVAPGDTPLTLAAEYGISRNALLEANGLTEPVYLMPNQRLRIPTAAEDGAPAYQPLPGSWASVSMRPTLLAQGTTASLAVSNQLDGVATGELIDPNGVTRPITFTFDQASGTHVALLGFDAFSPPGAYTVRLSGQGSARPWEPIEQQVLLFSAGYGLQEIIIDPSLAYLLAPEIRSNEDEFLDTIFKASNPQPYFEGLFQQPVSTTLITAAYGANRSYNGGPVTVFHSGIDFGGTIGTPILAPAEGIVAFTGELELRGNAVVLDHGLGVMTAYYHLSEINVAVGQTVTTGQQIAAGGNTGLSTGPHLHWDLQVWGEAVDPQLWLETVYP